VKDREKLIIFSGKENTTKNNNRIIMTQEEKLTFIQDYLKKKIIIHIYPLKTLPL
jgi:hypothetical protein